MIRKLSTEDIWRIQKIAHNTWPSTFKNILSEKQLYYMLDLMYSSRELEKRMNSVSQFYGYFEEDDCHGFLAVSEFSKVAHPYLKINKLYVLPNQQGKSLGKALFNKAIDLTKNKRYSFLRLNVNRFNRSIGFYEKLGMVNIETIDIDIGNGYLMEDFVMQLEV